MDILSHGLWGAVYAKAANRKLPEKLNYGWAFFWGMFPDLFAFTPIFLWSIILRIMGKPGLIHAPRGDFEPWKPGLGSMNDVTQLLYSISHSIVVFAIVFGLVWVLLRQPPWILVPWVMHILLDIPSHSYKFYPTPLFWPIANWKFLHGVSWAQWWVMAINYGALLIFFLILLKLDRK